MADLSALWEWRERRMSEARSSSFVRRLKSLSSADWTMESWWEMSAS